MSAKTLVGIVLAAGESARMGSPKQLLPFRGTTLLNYVVRQVENSQLDAVVVVTGAHGAAVESQLQAGRAIVVRNPDYRRGNVSSLSVGAGAMPDAGAVLLVNGDMPEVDTELIDRFVGIWHEEQPWAAVGEYRDGVAHPFLLSAAARDAVLGTQEPKALWRLLVAEPAEVVRRVPIDRPRPTDVNTAEDYEALLGEGWPA